MKGRLIFGFFWTLVLTACGSDKKAESTEPAAVFIYTDYKVSAEEESDSVTIMLQFRDESLEEQNIRFADAGQVTLDGKPLGAGQTKMLGTYYEIRLPLKGFTGKHEIVFTDKKGKKHPDYFLFEPLKLAVELPDTISSPELKLEFEPLHTDRPVIRVVINDTSYLGEGINKAFRLRENHLVIDTTAISSLHEGPVMLQCWLESETETNDPATAGGLIAVSYSFRRQFYLRKSVK